MAPLQNGLPPQGENFRPCSILLRDLNPEPSGIVFFDRSSAKRSRRLPKTQWREQGQGPAFELGRAIGANKTRRLPKAGSRNATLNPHSQRAKANPSPPRALEVEANDICEPFRIARLTRAGA